jgi:beta-glucosidase
VSVVHYLLCENKLINPFTRYNALDGHFCSQTPLIKSLLRDDWKFDGCIMSDWYGTKSTSEALEVGLDLEMPGPSVYRGSKLLDAIKRKEVSEEALNAAVANVLLMVDRTSPSHSDKEEESLICDSTSAMALKTASEGIVLLKNEHNILPLDLTGDLKVALIGAAAVNPSITGGGSACAKPQYVHTPLSCFQDASKDPTQVSFVHGVNAHHVIPLMPVNMMKSRNGLPGVTVDYYLDSSDTPVYSEHSEQPVVVMLGRLKPGLTQTGFHYIMETTITANERGKHTLAVQATGEFTLCVDGIEVSIPKSDYSSPKYACLNPIYRYSQNPPQSCLSKISYLSRRIWRVPLGSKWKLISLIKSH